MEGVKKKSKAAKKNTTRKPLNDDAQIVNVQTLDSRENQLQNVPVMIDLENKMGIVHNVLKACIKENNDNVYYYMDYIVTRLAFLTNLPKPVLSEIVDKVKDPPKTDILEESVLETPAQDLFLRKTLVKYYIEKKIIPKKECLTEITQDHPYNYQLHQQLKRSGYIWRRLHNSKRAILVEHPKRVMQRQRYLQKMATYRNENRPIVYIEAKIYSRADKDIRLFKKYLIEAVNFLIVFIAVVNDNRGFLNGHIFASKSIYISQKLIEEHIIKNIIPTLSEPSVIILEDKPYYKKRLPVPTIESEKSEMLKWLKINGIPHEENFHRSELFEMIQRCKNKKDLHDFDAILHAYDHEILRRPPKTEYLNYYRSLWTNISSTEDVTIFISKKSLGYWKNLEVLLIRMEKAILYQDSQIDNITDKILTMAKNVNVNEWAEAECDEEDDSLTREEFIKEAENSFTSQELQERERQLLFEIKKFEQVITKT